jgi:hypothetical protein
MPASYRRLNYALRPGKAIERKMLCEGFRRLHPFDRVENYRYVGFGSIYFSDFDLFHRSLGLQRMLSIEKDAHAEASFLFNKPYSCIDLDCRPASAVLPGLTWDRRAIVWLDYDGRLDDDVLADASVVAARAPSGSMFLVSVNVQADREPDAAGRAAYEREMGEAFEIDAYRLRELRRRIGDALPAEVTGRDLRGPGLAEVSRRVVHARVAEALAGRNATMPTAERLSYRQVFFFAYSDGALMMTVGGVIVAEGEGDKFAACDFGDLDFARTAGVPYRIEVPHLTMKEMRHLNAQLPRIGKGLDAPPGVSDADIAKYAEIYRYFPTYAESVFA